MRGTMINYPHVAAMVFNTPLYATPEVISAVKAVLMPRLTGGKLDSSDQLDLAGTSLLSSSAEEHELKLMTISNNIAIIPIHGVLVSRRGTIDNSCSELISYERLRVQISAALNHPDVSEVVLDLHTGGGMAMGCMEFADFVYQSRSIKPITAIVNFAAYSAGYFIAAACSKVICSPTGGVGSVGVIMETYEVSVWEKEVGIKYNTFYRGARKNDASQHEPLTEEAAAEIDGRLDVSYKQFVSSVAKYRNLEEQVVIDTQAKLFSAEEALSIGFVDEISPAQEAIDGLASAYDMTAQIPSIGIRAKQIDLEVTA
ncbi:MAG: S49 family peptidase [Oceanospirillaceae bacterium]|nr:S49 family peptidase [Oceanospirillaceae bacterium]